MMTIIIIIVMSTFTITSNIKCLAQLGLEPPINCAQIQDANPFAAPNYITNITLLVGLEVSAVVT
jgi:hypothetical protein